MLSKVRPYERSEENGGLDSACCARAARRIGGSGSSMKLVIVTILGAKANKNSHYKQLTLEVEVAG